MSQENCIRNPVIPGFNPDPSIVRVGADFFLVTSTFEYFPGIPIYHSRDLTSWRLIGHVLTRSSQLQMRTTEPSGGVWAPTLRYHASRKRFYVSVGITQRFRPKEWDIVIPCGFYVWTNDIFAAGSWSEPIHFDVPGIDQDLFFDDNGKTYFSAVNMITDPSIKKYGLGLATHTCEIDLDSGRSLGPSQWTKTSNVGIGIAEGPHIFKKDGIYYLSTAEGGTDDGHQQWICRSKVSPLGPWEEGPRDSVNPVIFNADHADVRNTGHMDIVEDLNGNWWAFFLGVRPQGENRDVLSSLGRETFMAPLEWKDGWPIVNSRKPIELLCPAKGLSPVSEVTSWRDNFDSGNAELDLGWYHLRTPLKQQYSLTSRPGYLSLFGNAYTLWDSESPCMVLQKQTRHSLDWRTRLVFRPGKAGCEAGTVIWWSQFAYASIGIRRKNSDDGSLEVHCRAYDEVKDEFVDTSQPLDTSSNRAVDLLIHARPTRYDLCFSTDGSDEVKLGEITTKSLTHRKSGKESPNTGAHLGLYAHGAYFMPCRDAAVFEFAEWTAAS